MIEINLLPEDLQKKEKRRFKLPEWERVKIYVIAVGIFVGLQFLVTAFGFYQKLEILAVRGQIAALKQENPALIAHKAETMAIEGRLKKIEILTTRKFYWASLLSNLAQSITKGVWLRELSVREAQTGPSQSLEGEGPGANVSSGRQLRLLGSAIGAGQETTFIGKYVKGLKENSRMMEWFDQVEVSNIYQRKARDHDVYDFELSCAFKREVG
ncbi:MAG: PilN domain-containing protein [Candidatus Omnitrophota bacterium]